MRRIVLLVVALLAAVSSSAHAQDQIKTGTIASITCPGTGCVELSVAGGGTGALEIAGTWSGVVEVEASIGCSVFNGAQASPLAGGAAVTSSSANGAWLFSAAGLCKVRLRGSSWTSGTATVAIRVSRGTALSSSSGGGGGSLTNAELRATPVPISTTQLPLLDTGGLPSTIHGDNTFFGEAGPARVLGSAPAGTEAGLVVRPIPSGTQAISAAALPLPTGAATASAQTDGTQKAIARSAAKGATTAGDVTSTAASANRQPLDTTLYTAPGVAYDARQVRSLTFAGDAVSVSGSTVSLASPTTVRAQQYNASGGFSSFTSATALDASISQSSVDFLSGVILAIDENATGGFSGGQLNFEAQQATTGKWVPIPGLRFDSLTLDYSFALSGFTAARSWHIVAPPGVTTIRVRLNPAITGAGTLTLNLVGGSAPLITRAITSDPAAETSLASVDSKTPALVSGRQPVDGSGVTQPISAVSLPLPTGAATSANQTTGNASLASIDTKLTNPLPVSAASLPLPAGAATSANQTTANASLSSIDTKLTAPLSVTGPLTDGQLRATPVPVSNASLPLPANAAQETGGNLAAIAANTPALTMGATPVFLVTPAPLPSPFRCNTVRRTNCSP